MKDKIFVEKIFIHNCENLKKELIERSKNSAFSVSSLLNKNVFIVMD